MREEPDLVGTMLGSYRIHGELSRGGMGAVYRAQHAILERDVAIKLLRPELTQNAELMLRFVNEAKAASAIQHPGIIEVLDFGHAPDGRAYFVMEMLEGESLARRIELAGALPERDAANIARGIANALTAAHDKGIIHRDLKPDNVFLVADPDVGERPKVLDFGIAKLVDAARHTQTGALMGTPAYMAPEQARAASAIDLRADLYSLGCVLYEMLTGQPPFVALGAGEIIALQLFSEPTRPSERGVAVSPAVESIVMRLLEKNADDRYQSAAELVAAIDAALGERPAQHDDRAFDRRPRDPNASLPPPIGKQTLAQGAGRPAMIATSHTRRRTRSSPALVAGIAVGVLVALGIVAFVLTRSDERAAAIPRDPPPAVVQPKAPEPTPAPPPPAPTPVVEPRPVDPPVEEASPAPPARVREKSRPTQPRHTKQGSPIEIDLN
jgi:serine/threonine protein kinase